MIVCGINKSSQLDKNSSVKNSYGETIINPAIQFHVDPSIFLSFSTNYDQTVYITKEGKSYVTGDNTRSIMSGSLPQNTLTEDTEFILNDQHHHPFKFISVVCGQLYTLYLVSDETGTKFHLVYCFQFRTPNPLFLNIGNRIPQAIFGGCKASASIDTEGGVIAITESVFKQPTQKIEATFLPFNEKAVKLAFSDKYVISLSKNGRVFKSKISGSSLHKFDEVKELSGKSVIDISGSFDFCFAVLEDGRVFGRGSNCRYKLGLPEESSSTSTFEEIESLKKFKIVSAFAGSFHSIFKTSDGKMIVCGDNNYGQLFISPRKVVYPPEVVESYNGFNFCVTGSGVSAAFVGIDPPLKMANIKIDDSLPETNKSKKSSTKNHGSSTPEEKIAKLKKKLASKDEQISSLKEELKKSKKRIKKLEKEIDDLKNEPKTGNMKIDHPMKIFTTEEVENLGQGKRIGRGATSEVFEVIRQEKIAKKVLVGEIYKSDKSGKNKSDDDDDDDYNNEEDKSLEKAIDGFNRLVKEYEVINSLDHPNIIKTFGFYFGDSTHEPAIFLEYCESNLKKRIKKLPDEKRISAIVSLSSAMKLVHNVGIIHRDLKLENILLDSDNNVKLSDFGICTFIKPDEETLNRTEMAGTLKFMAPELIQGRTDYDEKVDVYSFGVVVYLILTKGEYPDISIVDIGIGKQAKIPKSITKFSAQLIRDCWSFKSKDRPSFAQICERLNGNEYNLI